MNDAKPVLQKRLSHMEQIAERCVHFNGVQNDRCEAGIAYADVTLTHDPVPYRRASGPVYTRSRSLPCLQSMNLGGAVCEKRCMPTAEQVAAEEAESERSISDMMEALKRVLDATKGERGVSGSVECPRCKGKLQYAVARSNGHVHARCATPGCLAWMQ